MALKQSVLQRPTSCNLTASLGRDPPINYVVMILRFYGVMIVCEIRLSLQINAMCGQKCGEFAPG